MDEQKVSRRLIGAGIVSLIFPPAKLHAASNTYTFVVHRDAHGRLWLVAHHEGGGAQMRMLHQAPKPINRKNETLTDEQWRLVNEVAVAHDQR